MSEGREWAAEWPLQYPGRGVFVVYELWAGNRLVYIGQTNDLLGRLSAHWQDRKRFDRWKAEEFETRQLAREEERMRLGMHRMFADEALPLYNKVPW